ncbi:hypothetical protein [Halanaeroarchaeum sp. HSR-CO]|uniref:hypothetical protein n=1 Tax=Halanaeroarchaeum sp. HSR-CO TaxID=2866382 RepID=UPI00217ED0A6|nr:hypothetical protein [Halanaeroarchaeum sp. HSR-CO]
MVDREITDGRRIADLLRAEVDGLSEPPFDEMVVGNERADADTEPPGNRIFDVERGGDSLASVYLQDDRISLEVEGDLVAARESAEAVGLRTRPKATTPPGLLVFVENGATIKRALDVLEAAATGTA